MRLHSPKRIGFSQVMITIPRLSLSERFLPGSGARALIFIARHVAGNVQETLR